MIFQRGRFLPPTSLWHLMTLEFHRPTSNWACHTLWLLDIHSCPPSAPQLDPGLPRYGFLPPSHWRRGQEIQCNPQSFWPRLVVFDSGGPNTQKCWHEAFKKKNRSSLSVGLPWFSTFFQSLCEFRRQRWPFKIRHQAFSADAGWSRLRHQGSQEGHRNRVTSRNLQKASKTQGSVALSALFDVPNDHGCNLVVTILTYRSYRLRQYVVNIC